MWTKSLKGHQILALECMKNMDSLAIWYPPGAGKTAIALSWVLYAYKEGLIKDALVICPASLVANWEKDIEEFTDFENVTEEDIELLKRIVTVRSYQKIYRSVARIITRKGQQKKVFDHYLRDDVDKYWGAVILDEAHCIGGKHDSANCECALALSRVSKYHWLLTGTPISGSSKSKDGDLKKLYGQLKFLDDKVWRNWTDFCDRYVIATNAYWQPTAYKADELKALMRKYGIMCRLEDCFDLPDAIIQKIPCRLSENKVYKDITKQIYSEYGLRRSIGGSKWGKLMQLCSGHFKTDTKGMWSGKCSKEDVVYDILDGTDDPTVIFCKYTESINRVAKICKKAKKTCCIQDSRAKGPVWKDFVAGRYDVIICQYQSGGAGLNLQNAHTEILYEPPNSVVDLEQAKGRIYRPGQKNECRYVVLYTPNTVEDFEWRSKLAGNDVTDDMRKEFIDKGLL